MSCLIILTKEQILQSENKFNRKFPEKNLIKIAGQKIWKKIFKKIQNKKTLILAGPGNNGEDGRLLFNIAQTFYKNSVEIISFDKDKFKLEQSILKFRKTIQSFDIIIDSIFGIGLNRKIDNFYKDIFKIINISKKYVISIDLPSGIFCDDGTFFDTCVCAHETLVMGFFKPCHFLLPAKAKCGKKTLVSLNLEVPTNLYPKIYLITEKFAIENFPQSKIDDHKHKKGSALVLGGKMAGASRLVALASRKIGAGLSTIKVSKKELGLYSGTEPGTIINFDTKIDLNKYTSVVVGPGLGRTYKKDKIIEILKNKHVSVILDADGLSVFNSDKSRLFKYLKKRSNTILTPHEGEFKKLFNHKYKSKILSSLEAAKSTNSVIIYKGNDTVVASPRGDIWINDNAFENLATAGSGDILCGLIAGILCRNKNLTISSILGVWFQGKLSQNSNNIIAEDFICDIPYVLNKLGNE